MKPEALLSSENMVNTMQSTSSPFPNLDKQNLKKNRYTQFQATPRVSLPDYNSREDHDSNNSPRSDLPDGNFKESPNHDHEKPNVDHFKSMVSILQQNYGQPYNPPADYPLWLGRPVNEVQNGIKVTAHGFISLQLENDVRVDITLDQAIRCINNSKGMILSVSSDGTTSAFLHPFGKIYQYGNRVEIAVSDLQGNAKYAKMWRKGISFTSHHSALVYLLDSGGPRTTIDCFSDLHADFSAPVFLEDSTHGPCFVPDCIREVRNAEYWVSEEGTSNWAVNGIRISQYADGLVRVARGTSKYILRISGPGQFGSLITPNVHGNIFSAPHSRNQHVVVERGEKGVYYDGSVFIVNNGTHAAGFDEKNQFKVY